MSNENCYGCVNLRQFSKKECEGEQKRWTEDMKQLREYNKEPRRYKMPNGHTLIVNWSGPADTSCRVARCLCDEYKENNEYMLLTAIDLVRFDNCKYYKLGEKSKKQVFEEFKKSGYYGEVLSENEKGIKYVEAYIPKDSIKKLIKKEEN
ncbi:hypothetical protein ES705_28121 [subsurface metagenome]